MEKGQGDFAENAFGDEVGVSQFDHSLDEDEAGEDQFNQIPDGDVQRVFAERRQAQWEELLEDAQRILREVKGSRFNRFEDRMEHYVFMFGVPIQWTKSIHIKTNEYLWIENLFGQIQKLERKWK